MLAHEFCIISDFDKNKDYGKGVCYIEEDSCVIIDDDAIYSWRERIQTMKSYFHRYSRPATGLDWWGITIIPPESLDLFYDIVENNTNSEFIEEVPPLLKIIIKAKENNNYIIHFGV